MKNEISELSFTFGVEIIRHHQRLAKRDVYLVLGSQLLRSGTAVGALYREAQYAQSRADFVHKLSIARKECNESIYWLDLLHETSIIDSANHGLLKKQALSILKLLSAIIQSTRANTQKRNPNP